MGLSTVGKARKRKKELKRKGVSRFGLVLVIALRPQTPKHIKDGWSHFTDTNEPVNGNGAQNMVTVQSWIEPATFRSLAHELTNCANRAYKVCFGRCQ
jgi:hypothetical protein